jgi:hypothetical protein
LLLLLLTWVFTRTTVISRKQWVMGLSALIFVLSFQLALDRIGALWN